MKVQIAGAGFSGLTMAYLLCKKGIQVELFESEQKPGGLLRTEREPEFLAEWAANGLLWSPEIETMFKDLNLPMIHANKKARKRYIFREKRRRWPLTLSETTQLLGCAARTWIKRDFRPRPLETVRAWGERCLGTAATEFLLAPALQGIYAGDISKLSAGLIFGKRMRFKDLIAPAEGMSDLIEALSQYVYAHGGVIHYGQSLSQRHPHSIWAVSAKQFQRDIFPQLELLSLIKVTVRLKSPQKKINGFGVLFPRGQEVRALGALSSEDIFGRPIETNTEAWLFGGALDPQVLNLSDEELIAQIQKDRLRLLHEAGEIEKISISRQVNALPHYTVELEAFLDEFEKANHRHFTGNYLGQLGLAKIFDRNCGIAEEWGHLNV